MSLAKIERLQNAYAQTADEVEQILGKALGYPWFKDDQKNFPGATEADGVCVGEHVPESIAAEAADRIEKLRGTIEHHRRVLQIILENIPTYGQIMMPVADHQTGEIYLKFAKIRDLVESALNPKV